MNLASMSSFGLNCFPVTLPLFGPRIRCRIVALEKSPVYSELVQTRVVFVARVRLDFELDNGDWCVRVEVLCVEEL